MVDMSALKQSYQFGQIYKWVKDRLAFNRAHPNYFRADGITVFVGSQGSGKTLSAVNYVYELMEKYPKAILVTNVALRDYPFGNGRVYPFDNAEDLARYNNGEFGVVFLIDEIQLYFNSLESKNINPDVMVQFSQQRKQRKHIVCTSQVFGRMAKPLREQFSTVILCKNYFNIFQSNSLIDRDSLEDESGGTSTNVTGKCRKCYFWFHRSDMYGRYDTYYTISRNKFISEERKVVNIYDSGLSSGN